MISKGIKSIFPIKNQEIWDRYKLHIQAFWTPEEVSLQDDLRDLQTLNEGEQHFIKSVLAFFANSEAMIIVNTAVGITERTMRTSWVRPLIPNREVNKNANPAGTNNRSITTRRRALELSRENFVES